MKKSKYLILLLIIGSTISCSENQPTAAGLIEVTGCKSNEKSGELISVADTLSCVKYEFIAADKFLRIKHINAAFNCCPGEITSEINFNKDTLIIKEKESESLCDCNCLYDLEFEAGEIPDNTFILKIVEEYQTGEEELVFEININEDTNGEFCVTRKDYPWGI